MKDSTKGSIYALLAVLLFATLGTTFKLSVSRLDGYSVTVYMGSFAVLALFLNLLRTGEAGGVVAEFRRMPLFFILTGVIGLGVQQLLCIKSYEHLPAAQVVILTYTYPLMMIVLARLVYREHSSLRSVAFVLLGFMGVFILVSGGSLRGFEMSSGVLLSLACAFTFALFCVLIKHARFHVGIGMFLFNLFGLLFLLLLMPFYGFTWRIGAVDLLILLYIGVFPTALAFILWNRALQLTRTSHSSNFALLTPVLSLVFITLFLREEIVLSQVVGMSIIIGAVFLNLNFGDPVATVEGNLGQ
ncbi:DMT family transporter [Geomonas sp. RF6]|uniref:DMT family transporter n=1 Tax=Geomonas sp. RF6 TaxID=2897342 RepID=UPI001E31BBFA|nr:DMT family transporter [Geomonas sp. RF6]UFS70109.1 DMT family transporter [Geomonas sp. RF6]